MISAGKQSRAAATVLGIMILVVAVLTYAFRLAAHLGSFSELTNTLKMSARQAAP